jgi:hypothetical protein
MHGVDPLQRLSRFRRNLPFEGASLNPRIYSMNTRHFLLNAVLAMEQRVSNYTPYQLYNYTYSGYKTTLISYPNRSLRLSLSTRTPWYPAGTNCANRLLPSRT